MAKTIKATNDKWLNVLLDANEDNIQSNSKIAQALEIIKNKPDSEKSFDGLGIGFVEINQLQAPILNELFSEIKELRHISFYDLKIDFGYVKPRFEALNKFELKTISFDQVSFSYQTLCSFLSLLKENSTLESLILNFCCLKRLMPIKEFIAFISDIKALKELELIGNDLDADDIIALLKTLRTNHKLEKITLCYNYSLSHEIYEFISKLISDLKAINSKKKISIDLSFPVGVFAGTEEELIKIKNKKFDDFAITIKY